MGLFDDQALNAFYNKLNKPENYPAVEAATSDICTMFGIRYLYSSLIILALLMHTKLYLPCIFRPDCWNALPQVIHNCFPKLTHCRIFLLRKQYLSLLFLPFPSTLHSQSHKFHLSLYDIFPKKMQTILQLLQFQDYLNYISKKDLCNCLLMQFVNV